MRRLILMLFRLNLFLTAVILVMCVVLYALKAKADEAPLIRDPEIETTADPNPASLNETIKVMIIDTGIDADQPLLRQWIPVTKQKDWKSSEHEDYVDRSGHGTHVAGIILFGGMDYKDLLNAHNKHVVCKQVQLYSCKYYDPNNSPGMNLDRTVQCLKKAADEKMNVVNYSSGGAEPHWEEYAELRRLQKQHAVIAVAAGNDGLNLQVFEFYPASYAFHDRAIWTHREFVSHQTNLPPKQLTEMINEVPELVNVVPVGAKRADGRDLTSSNHGMGIPTELGEDIISTLPNNRFGRMSGTSQATPMHLHKMLMEKCKELNPKELLWSQQ